MKGKNKKFWVKIEKIFSFDCMFILLEFLCAFGFIGGSLVYLKSILYLSSTDIYLWCFHICLSFLVLKEGVKMFEDCIEKLQEKCKRS